MIKFKDIFKKSSVKIGFLVAGLFISLLLFLNYSVLTQSQESFSNVVEKLSQETPELPMGRGRDLNILRFTLAGTERLQPLHEEFRDNLSNSLISTITISIILSFLIGYASSKLFTKPLNSLVKGMKQLRENNYKEKLSKTGTEEFDIVVDEFNELSKELNRVEELRRELVTDTSHEFKTPLTSLRAQLEGLQDGVLKFNKTRATELLEQVTRLTSLVNTLDEYTRLRSKNSKLKKKNIKVATLLNSIIKKIKTDIKITIEIEKGLIIKCDKELTSRVLENLIENSIRYSKGKNIIIKATSKTIIVQDDGIGVSNKHLKDIYERFYRIEKSRNRKSGGMGLGLAIVKEIVEAHGWSIKSPKLRNKGFKTVITIY